MDITVLEADGLPEQAFLSVRAGDTKRLRPFRPGESFSFSKCHDLHGFVQLDVYERLGSQMMNGLPSEGTNDVLRNVNIPTMGGTAISASLKVALSEQLSMDKREKTQTRHKLAIDAKHYMDLYDVWGAIQGMLHALLKLRPEDPLSFMLDYLAELQRGRNFSPQTDAAADLEATLEATADQESIAAHEEESIAAPVDFELEEVPDLTEHHSLMAKVLRRDPLLYARFKDHCTSSGVSMARCIKPGIEVKGYPGSALVGAVAGDEESYEMFKDLFNPIISERHGGYDPEQDQHPATDLDADKVDGLAIDETGRYAISSRIRGGRNVRDFRLLPASSPEELLDVERLLVKATGQLRQEDLEGEYFPLASLTPEHEAELERHRLLFRKSTSLLQISKGVTQAWPKARGVFATKSRNVVIWCNEEEHLRIISMDMGADLRAAFRRFANAVGALEAALREDGHEFARNDRLGFIAACPSNLGTGLRVSVMMRLPLLMKCDGFQEVCSRLRLDVRTLDEGHATSEKAVCEVVNQDRLGLSEVDVVNTVIEGCRKLVQLELRLETEQGSFAAQAAQLSAPAPLDADNEVASPLPDELAERLSFFAATLGLGEAECPGFPADVCPEQAPDVSGHHSIMADVLRRDASIYNRLRCSRTQLGVGLARCIKSGMDNPSHPMLKTVGALAGDEECFETFQELFDPILELRHGRRALASTTPHPSDMSSSSLSDAEIDPTGTYALSVRIRTSRGISGFRFPTACDRAERCEVERLLTEACAGLSDLELSGDYFPLRGSSSYAPLPQGMLAEDEEELSDSNLLFQEPDSSVLLCSGMGRHWPEARGVFAAQSRKLVAWINEEDHLRLVSLQTGGGLREAFERLARAVAEIEAGLQKEGRRFARSDRLGHLVSCPSNVGTSLAASVILRLPLLTYHPRFLDLCRGLGLQARSGILIAGQEAGVWDVTNTERLGVSEAEVVNKVLVGCAKLVNMEQALERGEEPNIQPP